MGQTSALGKHSDSKSCIIYLFSNAYRKYVSGKCFNMTLFTRKKIVQYFDQLEFRTAFRLILNGFTYKLSSGLLCLAGKLSSGLLGPAGKSSKGLRLNYYSSLQMTKCSLNYVIHFLGGISAIYFHSTSIIFVARRKHI